MSVINTWFFSVQTGYDDQSTMGILMQEFD